MVGIIRFLRWVFASPFKSRERLKAENLALRHQVTVLRRSAPQRLRLRGWDRFLFVWLYRLWPSVLDSIIISHERHAVGQVEPRYPMNHALTRSRVWGSVSR